MAYARLQPLDDISSYPFMNGQNPSPTYDTSKTFAGVLSDVNAKGFNSCFIIPDYNNGRVCYYTIACFNLPDTLTDYYVANNEFMEISGQNTALFIQYFENFATSVITYFYNYQHVLQQTSSTNLAALFNTTYTKDNVEYRRNTYAISDYAYGAIFLTSANVNLYINGSLPVTYQWTSVPAISGPNGILSLTQITDEAIGDGSQKMHQPYESILRFTDQSNIRQLIRNLPQNERRVIAYSGLNRLEVKWIDSQQYPDSAEYTLYFVNHYGEGNNQYYSTIYQIDGSLPYDGTEDKFLSMIIDRENEVAKYSEVTLIHDPTIPEYNNTVNYSYYSPSSTEMAALYLFIIGGDDDPQDEDDPYATGSTDGGGDGNPFQPQDHLGLNNKPTKSGLNLGFVTLYKPTETQLDDIARFMWSDDVLDNFKKYFNNFADNIISLMIIPYNLTSLPSKKFKVGNMESDKASLQSVEYVTDRYVDIDMGDFYIDRKWDSYLDCSPYSKLEIYLPYCGTHSLDTDEIMYPANLDGFIPDEQGDPHLHINYRLDVATGNIVATLLVNDEIRYQFTGKCGMTVPLTGADYQNLVLGSITAGAGLAATIASGGATAPMTMSAAVTGTVMSQKPNNYRSGNMSGDISRLGFDTPYLIKTIPNLPEIKNQKSFTGYPSYRYGSIGAFSGFTQMIEAHIDNISCTDAERDKIMAYLKEGVII